MSEHIKEITLAGGCFWGTEKYFQAIKGVEKTEVGYANGKTENPTYEDVCFRNTGHAEVVKVFYDNEVVTLPFLLELYFEVIDPVAVNRQGNDVGTQYRTGIYYTDPQDLGIIQDAIDSLRRELGLSPAIEVMPLENYFPAEAYHQDYLTKNPGGYCHIGDREFRRAKEARDPSAKSGIN
jgi:peptide methionine sulfoxide reductase msrA/msrB